jgi:hypothetical protein
MNRPALIVLTLISILLPTLSLKQPRLAFQNRLLKGNVVPNSKLQQNVLLNSKLQRNVKEFRGGALFGSNEEENNMFDHLETLNEFASLQQDIYSPPSNNKRLFKQNQRSKNYNISQTSKECIVCMFYFMRLIQLHSDVCNVCINMSS